MTITVEENVITIVEVSTGARGLQGVQGEAGLGVTEAIQNITTSTKTADYTLALADKGTVVRMNVASSNNLTIPPASSVAFSAGNIALIRQAGAGQTTIVAGSGVTINARAGKALKIAAQNAVVSLHYLGSDVWDLTGDLQNI
jgi:hypothetical protein